MTTNGSVPSVAVGVLAAVGRTPLVRLARLFAPLHFELYAKLEGSNPGGSMKDRPAVEILSRAIAAGSIGSATTVIESSSGNFGIGLAQACAYLGLRFICVMDPHATPQNVRILRAYGAEVEVVSTPDPTGGYLQARIDRVRALQERLADSFWCNQYANPDNPRAHYQTMGEIAAALDGRVDFLFCATSTCGTLVGCADYVAAHGLGTRIVAVDARGSVIFGDQPARRLIPGHGAARVPEIYRAGVEAAHLHVSDLECIEGCRLLLRREAILAGGSSGAVVQAVGRCRSQIPAGARVALILPDRGERYLDTIYCDEWVARHFPVAARTPVALQKAG